MPKKLLEDLTENLKVYLLKKILYHKLKDALKETKKLINLLKGLQGEQPETLYRIIQFCKKIL